MKVEHTSNHPKDEGLSPAADAGTVRGNMATEIL
jgi:hypothetical protein